MDVGIAEAHKLDSDISERLYYIAKLNPKGVNKLATKYGYQTPREKLESKFNFLNIFFLENCNDDKAIDDLVMTHPDFGLFSETVINRVGKQINKNKIPNQHIIEEEENFVDIEEFGNFDGFMDDNYSYNEFDQMGGVDPISNIAAAVGKLGESAGKFAGTGKRGRNATQNLAEEATKQKAQEIKMAAIAAKQEEKTHKAKTKRIIIISSIVAVVIIIAVVLFIVLRKKK